MNKYELEMLEENLRSIRECKEDVRERLTRRYVYYSKELFKTGQYDCLLCALLGPHLILHLIDALIECEREILKKGG